MITIIPAIDLIDGKCVRLQQGRFEAVREYKVDPLTVAREFEQQGCQRLHLVDLDGARLGKIINWPVLEKITGATGLLVDFGGGIRSQADLELVFNCGATQATVGSVAVTNRSLFDEWFKFYGCDKIILAADFLKNWLHIGAWGKNSGFDVVDFLIDFRESGIRYVICTDIEKDGLLQGPAFEMYRVVKKRIPDLFLIASGGVTTVADIQKLDSLGVNGVIIGKALYEGYLNLKDLKEFLC
jgi:phosphoribosylformimino-5-aminoimidazole carboxamide ribotide isomerase